MSARMFLNYLLFQSKSPSGYWRVTLAPDTRFPENTILSLPRVVTEPRRERERNEIDTKDEGGRIYTVRNSLSFALWLHIKVV